MPVHRTKKRAFAIAVLVVALTVAAGAATAAAVVDTDQSPEAVSVVAASELEDGDTVTIVVGESASAPVTARLCNTDSRIGDDGACAAPVTVTATEDDGRLEVTLPIELGQIGSSPYAYCPSVPDFNDASATCSIVVDHDGGSFVAAQVVADPEGELEQTVSVEVSRVDDTEPPTVGGGTGTAPPPRPTTKALLPAPSDVPLVPAEETRGEGAKVAGDTLAMTGPSLTLVLAALGVALADLGWLLWSATKRQKSYAGV